MEDSMKQLMEMLSAMKEDMKSSHQKLEEKLEDNREDMKRGQEELKQDMRRAQEDMKANQEELKQKLEDKLQEMKTTIEDSNTKLENKLKEFEEAVEEGINQVKEEVKEDKKEINKKIEDLETKVRQLSTTGVIKTEGTLTTPSKVKVPTYDGKASWNTYLRQFEAVVRNWREEDKATSLIAALRGEALEVLRTITEASPNYATLTSALERRYGDAHLQHVYQAQLRSRRQRFEETLQQYEADISRMVNLAYPTAPAEVIEQLSVSSFIEGLRDPEIGQLVRLARHKTISEALAQALEIEAAKQASRGTSKIRQVKTYQYQDRERKVQRPSKNLVDSIKDVLEKFTDGQNSEDSTTNRRRPIRCWTCEPGKRQLASLRGRGLVRCYQAPPVKKIKITRLQNNGSSLVVPGRICGRECEMILDTGSSHTIVNSNIVAHCRIQNTDEDYQLETANGEVIPVKGVHLAEIRLGNSTFRQKVFVADITDDVLLGLNVMAEQNFILDLPQRVLKTNNEEIILNFPKIRALPIRTVKAIEDVEIPPQSEVVLEAICDDSTEEDETVIVEPKSENLLHHKGILTGRTLTVRKNNQMFVRIMNLKDYPQQISKGEPIDTEFKCRRTKLNGPEEWDTDTLAREQREDPDVGDIAQWKIEGKERPAWQEISNRSPTFKGYWALWDSLAVENNLLKRVWETYRSAVHESTGKTPASVVFGAELRLPIDLISDRPKKEEGVNNYISHLQDRLKLTHAEIRQKMRIESDRMKTRYDLRANTGGFQVGEKVWLYNPKRTKGKSPKLQKSWEGPYIVVTRLNDVVYRIQKNPQAKMKIVHIHRLTPYQEPHPNEGVT
ncbi:hypothetical protein NQ315_000465 [Exocentrus adspersus]|uniref:Integrase p58-like C-terminal domain-containing protein n=1 Tax=Exocentrus adspersus TaxID=1586481 RepID=A0AAV8VFH0_9CUCU|nr:hypothetical protein NQ315_000465 [Exocentrus adspersus]